MGLLVLLVEETLFLLLLERFLPPFKTATPVVDVGITCAGCAALLCAALLCVALAAAAGGGLPNIELAEFFIFDAALLAAPVILLKKLGCGGAAGEFAAAADDISKGCFEFISPPPFMGVLESFAIICAKPFVSFVSNC